jgi:hypothetical protein
VAKRKKHPAPARLARARHAIDRRQMVGIESVLEAEHEHQSHHARHFRMNKPSRAVDADFV